MKFLEVKDPLGRVYEIWQQLVTPWLQAGSLSYKVLQAAAVVI